MNGAVVFHGEVVAVGHFHAVENLYVLSARLENMASQHGTNPVSQPVVEAGRGAVEHHPEPNQGLALVVLGDINVAVGLWFEGGIARIEGVNQYLLSQRGAGMWRGIWTAEVKLMQRVADHVAAVLGIAVNELLFELVDPV